MISRFTLALKEAAGKGSSWDEDIFTNESFTARPLTFAAPGGVVRRSTDLELITA